MTEFTRADSCVIACAEIYRGDGEILANPTVGSIPCERSQGQTFRQERELRPHGISDERAIRRSHSMLGRRRISCRHTERIIAGASQLVTE